MSIEPIIAFFLLWDLRKILRAASPDPGWDKKIKLAMYAVAALFIIEIFLPVEAVTIWIWHLLLFAIIGIPYYNSAFFAARTIMLAVLPFVLLSLARNISEILLAKRYQFIDTYLDIATVFSIIWMIVMLIVSRKQQKALEKERLKTHEEEEQKIRMAERKAELEKIVAERTAELTQQKEELEKTLVELKTTQAQ